MSDAARAAADVAALLPADHPMAHVARARLAEHVRAEGHPGGDSSPSVRIGTPLRDAAVDPQAGDFLAPVNAGKSGEQGNPHGAHVASIQVDSQAGIDAAREARQDQTNKGEQW